MNKYFINRKEAFEISYIINKGFTLSHKADSLGKKKFLKPSEYEKDEFIGLCQRAKVQLLKLIDQIQEKYPTVEIADDVIEDISYLNIDKLHDCKKLGDYYFSIGNKIQSCSSINILMSPFLGGAYCLTEK
ncbi:hypothetical protein NE686_17985 [Tissierella carlieri]|uniref:Uncharacterized protein n=1 Tax=Tissierella carlieri TaxID=689904 RepID=A0ABT1SEU1_9FIRM|nr:hypothetical protein [Tissierella carlieri]MCQ4924996.1 hypothetical protein [Tissierella carlieri]